MGKPSSLVSFILLAAVSASASPAIPSFEFSAAQLTQSIATLRAEQIKTKGGTIGSQISTLTWDIERAGRDAEQLRSNLRWLLQRVRYQNPNDQTLRWDLQRFTQDLTQASRDAQWRLGDLRNLAAQAEKDETLVAPAQRLLDTTRRFKDATNWLLMDSRFAYFDLIRAGFTFEGMDLDRNSRDVDQNAQDMNNEANKLLTRVRGS
jgi:hypothetical protein